MSISNPGVAQKPRFSQAITTPMFQKLINNTLADAERAKRFIAAITSAVAVNPALQECEASTILAGALLGESLNLSPSPQLGQYYLVPFEVKVRDANGKIVYEVDDDGNKLKDNNGKWIARTVKHAQFILGYKGYLQLAIRSGQYADLDVIVIKEGEYLGKDKHTGKPRFEFIEDDDERDAVPTAGYMAYFEYLNGFRKVIYWSKKKMLNHADTFSPAFSAETYEKIQNNEIPQSDMWKYSSFWYKDFDTMARKTLLRQLISKWGIMSTEINTAESRDGSTAQISSGGEAVYTMPEPVQTPELPPQDLSPANKVNLDEL